MKVFKKIFKLGNHEVTIETGGIARQADGAVIVRMGDTVILATAVAAKTVKEGMDFTALTVEYQERMYAAGRIPGGFLKREGRPSEAETLIARLIDRPLRPMFPEGFYNEVQVIITVLSLDPEISPDVPSLIGASAALSLSGVPMSGVVAGVRVGYSGGQYVLNPSMEALKNSDLDLVIAGTENAVLMVESEAKELPEEVMLGAVLFGHEQMQVVIQAIKELTATTGKPRWDWQAPVMDAGLRAKVEQLCLAGIKEAYAIREKSARKAKLDEIKAHAISSLVTDADNSASDKAIANIFGQLEYEQVRHSIINGELRIDGRDTRSIRPIHIETAVLPRTHGSAVFTRGETQALVVTTMGNDKAAQLLDAMSGETKDRFMLHYNFPPYSVGEIGRVGSPKRREIGHGNLARRAIRAVLPSEQQFPYVLRVVSEITESNGSSSMATVCGTSLSLMDAGVPIKAPVAGIAMGLIKEGDKFAVLSDILGDEDHLGDMDFKVAGTANGVTALQMDIKITGITKEIMEVALRQAKEGRAHILGLMNEVISSARTEMAAHAPRIYTMQIPSEKIKDVIGKGGAVIRSITDETGVNIDLSDDGTVKIFAAGGEAAQKAIARIQGIIAEAEIGKIYEGVVARIADFGAFVTILPGKDGLVHVSQISDERVEKVTDVLAVGQTVRVKVLEIDRQGRIRLSMKEVDKSTETTVESASETE